MIAKTLLFLEILVAVVTVTSAVWAYQSGGIEAAESVAIVGVQVVFVISWIFSLVLARNK